MEFKAAHVLLSLSVFSAIAGQALANTEESTTGKANESAQANVIQPPVPGSGKVIYTKEQKQQAAKEATKIEEQEPLATPVLPTPTEMKRSTVALALGGGGARGAAHIGVLRVLKQENIPIDYIVGNSTGAIIGGFYAAGMPLDQIAEILPAARKAYMPSMIPPKILLLPLVKLRSVRHRPYSGLWTGNKFQRYLEKNLPAGCNRVEETKIPFSAVATNLVDGKAYSISTGDLATAIRASSAISPLLRPVPIGDRLYVDGGYRANLPASAARDTGANVVIGVLVDQPLGPVPTDNFRHLRGVANRLADIVLAVNDERQLQFADIVISPDLAGIPVLSRRKKDEERAIKAGELAARKALPAIYKKLGLSDPTADSVAAQLPAIPARQ